MTKVLKAKYANDIFTTEMEARARSMDLGLEGDIHVHEYDGQAVYMPGESHREYLERYEELSGVEGAEEDDDERMDPTEALRAVVAEIMQKADYQGEEVTLNKPFRLPSGSSKKFGVYVKDGDKTKKVTFGSPDMEIRRDDPDARSNFRARHNCDTATDKTSARYWSCRMWEEDMTVSEMTKIDTGDRVSWNSSGGTARGIVRQIVRDGTVPDIPVKVTGTKEEPAARIEIVDDEGKPTGEMVGHKLSTLRKNYTVNKAKYANDIFTTEMEARARSMDLGLEGDIHVHEYDGQAVYMPGESHKEYLEHYEDMAGGEYAEEERMDPVEALRAVVAEIMQKADYQGEEVTLNKPFRLPSGSSKKFGVYVKDGDKTKKVTFGSPDMEIRRDDPDARSNFRARHNCDTATDKTSARYWSCRMWEEDVSVSEMTKSDITGQILKVDEEQQIIY